VAYFCCLKHKGCAIISIMIENCEKARVVYMSSESRERKITGYFRDAIVSRMNRDIEITEDSIKMEPSIFKTGNVPIDSCRQFFQKQSKQRSYERKNNEADADLEEAVAQELSVIVAVNVVNVKSEGGVKHKSNISDLTGTLFVPAKLSETGNLSPQINALPWIPREHLKPIIDDALIVGDVRKVDVYLASKTKEIAEIKAGCRWKDYVAFTEEFWVAVNETNLCGDFIYSYSSGKHPLFLDSYVYMIPDNTISSTHHIKGLYETVLTDDNQYNEVYRKLVAKDPQPELANINNTLEQMKMHMGQMNGSYPLSKSQRESMNHFTVSGNGDVLAVNGPPGTGKTTLLQSIVANMVVERAIQKKDAPIIIATSTNNQAVLNIIESFADTSKEKHPKNLDKHWITEKSSFATYLPSESKRKVAIEKGYQHTDIKMGHTISQLEKVENIDRAKSDMLQFCSTFFGYKIRDLQQCADKLHALLCDVDKKRKQMLELVEKIPFEVRIYPNNCLQNIRDMEKEMQCCRQRELEYKNRLAEWKNFWRKQLIYRFFKFIPKIKERLRLAMSYFRTVDEQLPDSFFQLVDVEKYYNAKLNENRKSYQGYEVAKSLLEIAYSFEDIEINVFESHEETVPLSVEALNSLFDTNIRYFEFWLSVHYYECRWLSGEHKLEDKDLFKTTFPALKDKYKRLCMLTPCLVMTFFMLPKNFHTHSGKYLYDFIDLLIVDEAGQVSPEIGVASFLLAKKALVVGDIHQIEPVWEVSRELDIALAVDRDVISPRSFNLLEKSGLNTSESSLMRIASNACKYSKFGSKGLFLSEHRRCYDELISYCNELIYDGHLSPLRGKSIEDKTYPFAGMNALEHIQISTAKSEKRGASRFSPLEAEKISGWIEDNFADIKKAYPKENSSKLIGVITPFKAQSEYIKRTLPERYCKDISVGTVHTFQGGERRIILFSTVYGAEDGSAFLDYKPNLMNVAMSRAKDRFIIVGDIRCLSSSKSSPSGLLRTYIEQEKQHS